MSNNIILFLTQNFGSMAERRFNRIKESGRDCILMTDSKTIIQPEVYYPSIPSGFKTIDSGGCVFPGCIDYYIIDFYRNNPSYDNYWLVEYDVLFTGEWKNFFDKTDSIVSDILTPTEILSREQDPGWFWWDIWENDIPEKFHSLMPIRRYSREFLKELNLYYSNLKTPSMHFETLAPSLCKKLGMSIEVIPRELIGCVSWIKQYWNINYELGKLYHPEKV